MSSLFTNVDISDDESGMAKDILFKLRVEATERMTQNHFAVQESTTAQQLHLRDIYEAVISCLHSTLRPKT